MSMFPQGITTTSICIFVNNKYQERYRDNEIERQIDN